MKLILGFFGVCAVTVLIQFISVSRSQTIAKRQIENTVGYVVFRHRGPDWLRKYLGDASPFKSPEEVCFGMKSTDDDLVLMESFKQVKSVMLEGTHVKGPGLVHLRNLPRLEYIALTKSSITDEGLGFLGALRGLKHVGLAGSTITDQGVAHLAQLVHLEELNLQNTKVTDRCLDYLRALPLNELRVRGTAISPDGLTSLRKSNPNLRVYD